MKPISEELLPKPRKKPRTPDCVPEGNAIAPTRKARARRVKNLEGRKPPRRFKSKTPACGVDAMDWMLADPASMPKKRRSRKTKVDCCVQQSRDITADAVHPPQIPDLNEMPLTEEAPASLVVHAKRRGSRKKKNDVPDVNSSVTGDIPTVKVVRRRASKAKPAAVLAEGGSGSTGCEIGGPSQSDPGSVVDAVKPAKRTPRKYAPRKKKVPPGCKHQCHMVGSHPVIVAEYDLGNPVQPGVNGGSSPAQPLPIDSVMNDPSSVTDGLAPLLSALCEQAEFTSSEVRSAGSRECGNIEVGLAPEVIDVPQVQEKEEAMFPTTGKVKVPATVKQKRDSKKKWGGSIKRGCLAQFTVKTLLYAPHVSEICIIQEKHVNQDGLVVHGGMKCGDRSAFSAHLSPEIRTFVEECLRRKDSSNQIMKKHLEILKQYQADGRDITRDLLLTTKDIRNISGKLAQETYMLHKNDAQSVRMWVERNPDKVFYYTESNKQKPVPVPGELTGANMPFTIGIQTDWQRKMMLQHGHNGGISIDATFGTNERKVTFQSDSLTIFKVVTLIEFIIVF